MSALDFNGPELFRAVNERILELGPPVSGLADLVCECADEACTHVMRMSLAEYDAMRSDHAIHAVVPGHERNGRTEVIGRTERYVLVRSPSLTAELRVAG